MTLDKTPETIQTMFNMIADKYDFVNNAMSFGTQNFVKKQSIKLLEIPPHAKVLDLCCGTGDLSKIVKKQSSSALVTGIDFSKRMISIAKKKVDGVEFLQGDVTNLPYPDDFFDFVIMGFGLRNILNAEKAIEEVFRVLKPSGTFLHLDFGQKNLASKIYDIMTPILIRLFTENRGAYAYLIRSKQEFPTPDDLIKDFESKGLKFVCRKDFLLSVISAQVLCKSI